MTKSSLSDLVRTFARIGVLSFGGPAAQIALMQEELVEKRSWLSKDVFLRALSFCMLLPGPEAMQLATYAGWHRHGILGGLIAGTLFVLPGAVVIGLLALLYLSYGELPQVRAAFVGIQASVIVIVASALAKLARKALGSSVAWGLAVVGFAALFVFQLPYPLLILGAGILGYLFLRPTTPVAPVVAKSTATPVRTLAIWGALWAAPILLAMGAGAAFLTDIMVFFSRLAVVTFGGAYAVLAYMTQEVVQSQGWITTQAMIDALGLAETTPGPLILVTQFVAMLAGAGQGGTGMALAAGALTLWVTFIPCFLWIFLFAPYLERLMALPWLAGALAGVTAAVVGVIANLALWFALNVLFPQLTFVDFGIVTLPNVTLNELQLLPVALVLMAAGLLWRLNLSLFVVLPLMAAVSVVAHLFW